MVLNQIINFHCLWHAYIDSNDYKKEKFQRYVAM